jgi:photosystem II stability/assembly factor-like uncharacterized protein
MKRLFFLLLAFTSTALSFQFQPQWIKTGGPIGGLGYNVRVSPANKNIMYVTDAWSGVNRSTDGGQTWVASNAGIDTRLGPSNDAIPIFCLTVDHQNPNIVWAGTQGLRGIFKSTDGGVTWARKDNGISENIGLTIRNFQIQPGASDTLYASAELSVGLQGVEFDRVEGVLYKTTNGGASWTKILVDSSLFRWMCINPTDPQRMTIFTGIFDREALNTVGKGVLRTTDGGQTWGVSNQGIQGSLFVGGMSMHPTSIPTVLIGTGNYTQNNPTNPIYGGVFLTTNAGVSWTKVLDAHDPQQPGDPDNVFTAAAYSHSNPNIAYAANAVAFYKSMDGGQTWPLRYTGTNGAPYGPPHVRAGIPIEVTVDKDDPNTLFVNNYGGGVFKSTDGAQTWQVLGTGYTGAEIHKVAVDPHSRSTILVNGRSGPFKSTDAGTNWIGVYSTDALGYSEWYSAAIHPTQSSVMLLSDEHTGTIVLSTNAGTTWTKVFKQPLADASNLATRHGAKELCFAPSNPLIVYAGFAGANFFVDDANAQTYTSYGVYKSTNGGLTWNVKNTGLESTSLNIVAMAISQTDPGLVYVGTKGSGIFKTTNGGDQWVDITNNLSSKDIYALGVSATNSQLIYAGTKSSGVFKSTDGGASWSLSLAATVSNPPFTTKQIMSLIVDPTNDRTVYAADWRSGVYRSTDGGSTWGLLTSGLSTRAVIDLALSADGLYLYAATKGEGIFRMQTAFVAPPSPPMLSSPPSGSTGQALTQSLSWNAVPGADSYRIQVSSGAGFAATVLDDSTLTSTSTQFSSTAFNTTFYWRVAAKSLGGYSNWSATFSFTTIVAAPQTPALASPVDSAINISQSPTVSWQAATGAVTYHLQLSSDATFAASLVDDSSLTATSRTVGPLALATTYYWRVQSRNAGGYSVFSTARRFSTIRTTSAEQVRSGIPGEFSLSQNYPNPFNPSTSLEFTLPQESFVSLTIYSVLGMEIKSLLNEQLPVGYYRIQWNAHETPSGIYFLRLQARPTAGGQAAGFVDTKKMILLR